MSALRHLQTSRPMEAWSAKGAAVFEADRVSQLAAFKRTILSADQRPSREPLSAPADCFNKVPASATR